MRPERANANPLMDLVRHSLAGALLFNAMSKPKSWDSMTPEAQEAWKQKELEWKRKYRAENPEKIIKYQRTYQRKYQREYRAENPEKIRERERKYRAENPEKIREWKRKYSNQKAADQFFILAGAAESLTNLITKNKKLE